MASIRERNGSYQVVVSCGYDIRGKKLTETTTYTPDPTLAPHKRKKAVEDFAREFEAQIQSGMAMDGRKITLKEFSERRVKEYAEPKLQPGTVKKYQEELDDKILPALGHLKLSAIKPRVINRFLLQLASDGARKDGKPGGYSKGSIAKTRNVLSSLLRTAAEWEVISNNPCEKIRLQGEDSAMTVKYFTPEEAIRFLSYIETPYPVNVKGHRRIDDTGKPYTVGDYQIEKTVPEQIRVLFNLAIYTGLRKAELLALKWADISFESDYLQVTKAVTVVDGKQICKTPKTKSSYRTVSIPHFLTQRLHKLRIAQTEYRLKWGSAWKGDDWVFIQDDGSMMNYGTPYHAFQDVLIRYNAGKRETDKLPLIPFHGLRHTAASLLIASNLDIKTVSTRLGHAQTSTTLNIYTHAFQEGDRKATAALENILQKHA